jgi:hypothetical protein
MTGSFLALFFYIALALWGLFVSYVLVIKWNLFGTYTNVRKNEYVDASKEAKEEAVAEYVAEATHAEAPANLPTAELIPPTYAVEEDEQGLTDLEDQAHAERVLLSSDAMRFFIGKVHTIEDRSAVLATILKKAHISFPSEDGWVVINLSRMEELLQLANETEHDSAISDSQVTVEDAVAPMRAGSLAEAIALGNIVAAYGLIAHRPMIALADAASDFDAIYRARKGESVTVSELLVSSTSAYSDQQLKTAIEALTGAVDGTYTDEASAVKMAIMKAVNVLSL